MTQWLYDTFSFKSSTPGEEEESIETLNIKGRQGWEVTATIKVNTEDISSLLLLKRPIGGGVAE